MCLLGVHTREADWQATRVSAAAFAATRRFS
jgi:hypothetical protein